jgi:hypothetical protein
MKFKYTYYTFVPGLVWPMAGGVVAVEAVLGWPTWEDGDGLGDNGSLKGVVETRSVVRCSRHDGRRHRPVATLSNDWGSK